MKRLVLLTASLLAALGCAAPTGPSDPDEAAAAARARAVLEAASHSGISGRIALN